MDDLKSCPFCGAEFEPLVESIRHKVGCFILMKSPELYPTQIPIAWNRRTPSSAIKRLLKACEVIGWSERHCAFCNAVDSHTDDCPFGAALKELS